MAPPLPLIDLPADPGGAGRAHGEGAREAIAHNLALYARRFADEAGLAGHEVRRRGLLYLEEIRRLAPDYAAMVEGIAEGAGRPLAEIAALNARYEILYSEYAAQTVFVAPATGRTGADGCTAFAALPEASADGHLRLGQNWDWIPGVLGLLLRTREASGFRVLVFTEAGIAGGKIGLNSEGLGLAINGLSSERDDWRRLGLPFHARTWRALRSRTLAGAVAAVSEGARACAANFLLAQAGAPGEGKAVDVETAPSAACALPPDRGLLVHANHFADPARLGVSRPDPAEDTTGTAGRERRLVSLLREAGAEGGVAEPALLAALRDHEGYPRSVCHHEDESLPEAERLATRLSVVMDLHERRLLAAPGNPCVTPYASYRLA